MKICTKCQVEKELDCFYPKKTSKDGKMSDCKECNKTGVMRRYLLNKDKRTEYRKNWSKNNKDHVKQYRKRRREKDNLSIKKRYKEDKEYRNKIALRGKAYRNNPQNKEKIRERNRIKQRKSCMNPEFRIKARLRVRIISAMKGKRKDAPTMELVGCTGEQLKKYLESKFQSGMTWDNYGHGAGKWSIDHIIPCKSFDLTIPENQRKCFHHTNLQPMWFLENSSKGAKLDYIIKDSPPIPTINTENQATYSSNPPLSLV